MNKTKIETFDSTWNPVTGCLHGCEYCYARGIAKRFGGFTELEYTDLDYQELCESGIAELEVPLKFINQNGEIKQSPYPFYFMPTLYRYRLNVPQKWGNGRNIFVCSMADLFGNWVPDSWIEEVFKACEKAPQHNYLFLTKNPKRYTKLYEKEIIKKKNSNMWYGFTCTKNDDCRPFYLPCNTFVSIEPILEKMFLPSADWVIIGAETGRRKYKVIPKREWIEYIVNWCRKANIPVFMKSSLADIWGEQLIQEFPQGLKR